MVRRTTLNVSLTSELQSLLDEKLASGRYGSASEVVRDGLRLIEQRDRLLAIEELRAKIDVGWQQSERGEERDGEGGLRGNAQRMVSNLGERAWTQIGQAQAGMNPYKLTQRAEHGNIETVDRIAVWTVRAMR